MARGAISRRTARAIAVSQARLARPGLLAVLALALVSGPTAAQVTQSDLEREQIARINAGHELFDRQEYARAVGNWGRSLHSIFMTRGTMLRYGIAQYRLGRAALARDALTTALQDRSHLRYWDTGADRATVVAEVHYYLGRLAEDAGQWDSALAAYGRAGRLPQALVEAGTILVRRRADLRGGIRAYEDALRLMPPDHPRYENTRELLAATWVIVGTQEETAGRSAEAIAAYRAALTLHPGSELARARLARVAPGDTMPQPREPAAGSVPAIPVPLLAEWRTAVQQDDSARVALMLRATPELARATDVTGAPGLHFARYVSVVNVLLAAGASTEERDREGRTALLGALSRGHNEFVVRRLLAAGADVRASDQWGRTALHYALREPDPGPVIVASLIRAGAPLEVRDSSGATPLMLAVRPCRPDYVRRLRMAGASLETRVMDRTSPTRVVDRTLLTYAVIYQSAHDCVGLLLELGADPNQRMVPGGNTPLGTAALLRYPRLVATLLDRGADPRLADSLGLTPLHSTDTASALLLLGRGADVNAAAVGGMTPLHFAAAAADTARVRILVTRGASLSPRNRQSRTPLEVARLNVADTTRYSAALRNRLFELLAGPAPTARPEDD